jgi:hypothetical protein
MILSWSVNVPDYPVLLRVSRQQKSALLLNAGLGQKFQVKTVEHASIILALTVLRLICRDCSIVWTSFTDENGGLNAGLWARPQQSSCQREYEMSKVIHT